MGFRVDATTFGSACEFELCITHHGAEFVAATVAVAALISITFC